MVIAVNLFVFPSSLRMNVFTYKSSSDFQPTLSNLKIKDYSMQSDRLRSTLICPSYRALLIGFLHVYPTIDNTSRDAISQLFLLNTNIFQSCGSRYIMRYI